MCGYQDLTCVAHETIDSVKLTKIESVSIENCSEIISIILIIHPDSGLMIICRFLLASTKSGYNV